MSSTQANSAARTEPPSEARIQAARRQGLGPRAELAALAAAATLLVFALTAFGERGARSLQNLLQSALADGSASPLTLLDTAATELLWPFGLVLCGVLVAMGLARALLQGFVFSLRALAPNRAFPAAKSPRMGLLPVAIFALGGVLLSSAPELLRAAPSDWSGISLRFGLRAALLLSLLALLEASLSRAAFVRSLWMTREEQRREEREDQGSPELRGARARLRREAQSSGAGDE